MFTISFGLDLKKIEDLIMATKAELLEKIAELSVSVSDEAGQVRGAVEALEAVVSALDAKIATLELDANLTPEIEALAKVKSDIEGIYSPAVVPPAEPAPVEVPPVVPPVEPSPLV